MNLFDLVARHDRAVYVSGRVTSEVVRHGAARYRAVAFNAGSSLTIRNVDELTVGRHADWGWETISGNISVEKREGDLVISASSDSALGVGRLFDPRAPLLPLASGKGVEVGPGVKPAMLPSSERDVRYVERVRPQDWAASYSKAPVDLPPPDILSRYVVGDATTLETVDPSSMDFIFSNHVFEHLPNPLQVLENWLDKLRPGGRILTVVPDARYCFDCRQPLTTLADVLVEQSMGGHAITLEKYQRWVRYTEPRHSVDDLIRRNYSIHVSFFTPELIEDICQLLYGRGRISKWQVWTGKNNKDFAFAIWKDGATQPAQQSVS